MFVSHLFTMFTPFQPRTALSSDRFHVGEVLQFFLPAQLAVFWPSHASILSLMIVTQLFMFLHHYCTCYPLAIHPPNQERPCQTSGLEDVSFLNWLTLRVTVEEMNPMNSSSMFQSYYWATKNIQGIPFKVQLFSGTPFNFHHETPRNRRLNPTQSL